jgi:hypothetical protein
MGVGVVSWTELVLDLRGVSKDVGTDPDQELRRPRDVSNVAGTEVAFLTGVVEISDGTEPWVGEGTGISSIRRCTSSAKLAE